MSYPCVKCHSLDCIGCGRCEDYNMDEDGFDDSRDEALTEEELYDIEDFELNRHNTVRD